MIQNVPSIYNQPSIYNGGVGGGGDYPTLTEFSSVSHRGYVYNYDSFVENTIPAFLQALKNGFTCIEFDIRHTSDGVAVLSLDDNVKINENNGQTITISSVSYSTLETYTYYNHMQKINSLEEALDFFKDYDVELYIKINNGTDAQLAADYNLILSKGMETKVFFSSFTLHHLSVIKSIDRNATLVYGVADAVSLATAVADAASLKNEVNHIGISFKKNLITQSVVDDAIDNGLKTLAWTVNDPYEVVDFHAMGIDIFVSDYLRSDVILKTYRTISYEDFVSGGIDFNKVGATTSANNRITYNKMDIVIENGKTYLFRINKNPNVSKTIRYGIMVANGYLFSRYVNNPNESASNTDRLNSGWVTANVYSLNFSICMITLNNFCSKYFS